MLGARHGHEGDCSVSGQGGFHRWSVLGAAAVRGRDSRTGLRGEAWVEGAVRELGGVAGDEVEVQWEIEREISSVGLSEGHQGGGEYGRGGAVPVDGVLGRWPVG